MSNACFLGVDIEIRPGRLSGYTEIPSIKIQDEKINNLKEGNGYLNYRKD